MATQGKKVQKKAKIKPFSIFAIILCCAILLALGISIAQAAKITNDKKKELQECQTILESQEAENKALENAVSNGDTDELAEEYARKKGYVRPDERVYVDITPGSEE